RFDALRGLHARHGRLRADHHTGTGERRDLTLPDGSRVWLNTATAVQTNWGADLRRLVLLGGEILVQTAPDEEPGPHGPRPFVVDTAFGRLQALGTRFAVRHGAQQSRLDVFDGAVAIRTAAGPTLRVAAGSAARFNGDAVGPLLAADRAREAWSRGRLPADGLPLRELLAELSRYRRGHISVAPDVAGLKVMGVYPTDNTDQALDMLARSLPIRVQRSLPWWTTVEGAH
ncbi:MAG: iron dicitrate transport regulator FecR, partial [Comamonadaceae bacterium]